MSDSASHYPLLEKIDSPTDLRLLPEVLLPQVAAEVRGFLLATLSQIGGHFAGGLGAVELTVALHYVFNTPDDRIVWDVGHQSYPHKILTGRRDSLKSIRQAGGLSGFPKRSESPYDTFGVGHSSTSIGAALGMAMAAEQQGIDRSCVAVIGDGGMTAGMAFEALNHAGDTGTNMLVILNDNEMSISDNVGALSNYFSKVLSGKFYANLREGSKKALEKMPRVIELARKTEEAMKGMIAPGTLFEELGFNYIGPVDGHDLPVLLTTLKNIKALKGPQFLHVVTKKGKGYAPAEAKPIQYHAVTAADFASSQEKTPPTEPKTPSYSQVFGEWLCDMAMQDKRLVGITPAMREGSGMVTFAKEFPKQYVDVGIAEQHAVTLAAGMAADGLQPVVAIYSTFLQRAYDQLIHDVAIQNLPVLFAIDRAGIVGADGATHTGNFDFSYLRCIPNMVIMAPADENECRQMLYTGFQHNGPASVRYPRGKGPGANIQSEMTSIPIGKAEICRKGKKIAILSFGTLLPEALKAGEHLDATVVNMRFVKPLDEKLIQMLAIDYDLLVTLEDNSIIGGAGSGVCEFLAKIHSTTPQLQLALPDEFPEHGPREAILAGYGLDAAGIISAVEQDFLFQNKDFYATKPLSSV